jgi:hypothetical protein
MFFIDKNIYNDENSNIETHHYIGLISWYAIFIFIIPFLIIRSKSFNVLKYYLPIIDLLANIFSVSGKENKQVFKDVYSLSPNNIISFISTNFINLLALTGVAWNGVDVAIKRNSMLDGVLVMIIMYAVTYLIPTQGIPFAVNFLQEKIDKALYKKYDENKIDIYGYLGGIIVIIVLYTLEYNLIKYYLEILSKSIP